VYQPSAVTKQAEIETAIRQMEQSAGPDVVRIRREVDFPGLGVFPYHNFRSESEQAMLQEPAWA
jgi:hypothetical protein